MEGKKKQQPTSSFVAGAIALLFLIIGFEAALFMHRAAALHLAANRDRPDTVYVVVRDSSPKTEERTVVRKEAPREEAVVEVREKAAPRKVESFPFNPNTVSVEDLQRLGFSRKQAQTIENYRRKGGRFPRKKDFAKSFVVSDSIFERLAPFIDIPPVNLNQADSVALLDLPGIGPYFAGKIVRYRQRLQGFSCKEQLLEIDHFGQERYDGLQDLVDCPAPQPYPIWTLSEEELARHPHISRAEAHGIVLYREHHSPAECTLAGLQKAGILSEEHAGHLALCNLAAAP